MMTLECTRCGKEEDARTVKPDCGWLINCKILFGTPIDLCPDCVEALKAFLTGEDI